jgi:hypothetical protein
MTSPGLGIRCAAFRVPRRGHGAEECEDAFAVRPAHASENGGPARFAVADGAAESAFSGLWARLLAEEFVRPGRPGWPDWVVPLQQRWAEAVRLPPGADPLPWYLEERYREGAFATFLGVEVTPPLGDGVPGGRWDALAVGDSCLFHTRQDRLLAAFPLTHSAEFGNSPWLVGARTSTEVPVRRAQLAGGDYQPGDRLLLMTDALSRWFLSRAEAGGAPAGEVEGLLGQGEEAFAAWVRQLRDARQLRNDDTTMVAVCL